MLCLALVAASAGACFALYQKSAYEKNDGFSLSYIQFDLPHNKKWEVPPLSDGERKRLNTILSQSYTYLAKGARSYAFLSADGKYVLKFFKYRYHKPHWAAKYLPPVPFLENYRQSKMRKVSLDTVLTGYKVAYDHDSQDTALIYIHLNPTQEWLPLVTVSDKRGKEHRIDLNTTRFVLQERADECEEVLNALLNQGDIEEVKRRIRDVFDLYERHHVMGISDTGVGVLRNNGFIGNRAVHFDVGKMTSEARETTKEKHRFRMRIMAEKVEAWIKKTHPEYGEEVEMLLQEWTGNQTGTK